MKIAGIEVPQMWIWLVIATVGFALGIAVGVKATLSNVQSKILAVHDKHHNDTPEDHRDFHINIHEMFLGPYPLTPDNKNPDQRDQGKKIGIPNPDPNDK